MEALEAGSYELVLLPSRWATLFFKKYYVPRKTDCREVRRTTIALRRITAGG